MYSAWVIQRVCGGISLRWKRGGWRRRDYCDRGSASPRSPGKWAYIGSRSAAGRRSLNIPECAGCARPSAPAGHPSSARPSCATSSARSSAGPRRSASPAGCGPRVGCALSSSIVPGCATTRTTSGAFCASSTGAASVPAAKRSNATRRRSGSGRKSRGRGLKKSPLRAAHDLLHRRSGVSERPHRVRTWAPRGQTPVLQHHFNWKVLSAAAGITWWNFYFRLYPGAIHAAEVIDFLGHLLRHLPGKLLVVWDGLPQHRARLVAEFIRAQRGRLAIERLPAYAPELNPVEYIWGYWKHHELPNFCPRDFGQLSYQARRALRRMRRRPRLVRLFWQQANLSL